MMVPVFGEGIQYGAPPDIERQQLKMQVKGLKHDRMVNYAGIVEREAPIQVSNVAIFNPDTNMADRVGFKVDGDTKVRVFKSSGKAIDA